MSQIRFYEFRKKCVNGVLINEKHKMMTEDMKDMIDNIVLNLEEITCNRWKVELEEIVIDDSNIIYIDKI